MIWNSTCVRSMFWPFFGQVRLRSFKTNGPERIIWVFNWFAETMLTRRCSIDAGNQFCRTKWFCDIIVSHNIRAPTLSISWLFADSIMMPTVEGAFAISLQTVNPSFPGIMISKRQISKSPLFSSNTRMASSRLEHPQLHIVSAQIDYNKSRG